MKREILACRIGHKIHSQCSADMTLSASLGSQTPRRCSNAYLM